MMMSNDRHLNSLARIQAANPVGDDNLSRFDDQRPALSELLARGEALVLRAGDSDRAESNELLDEAIGERRYRSVFRDRRLLVAAAAVVLLGTAGASAFAIYGSGSAPGLTAGVSSLDRLPRPASLPVAVTDHLGRLAASAGISTADAEAGMRLLRVGLPRGDLYAFRGTEGRVCFILTRGVGLCPASATAGEPGVMWAVSAGYPGEESALVALVADNVSSVELIGGEAPTSLPIVNNSIYASLPRLNQNGDFSLIVSYGDGSRREIAIGNVYGTG
jgi:hypothetical protein